MSASLSLLFTFYLREYMTFISSLSQSLSTSPSLGAVCKKAISYVGSKLGLISKVSNCWIERTAPPETTKGSIGAVASRFSGIGAKAPGKNPFSPTSTFADFKLPVWLKQEGTINIYASDEPIPQPTRPAWEQRTTENEELQSSDTKVKALKHSDITSWLI
jgi:hypothetical protein